MSLRILSILLVTLLLGAFIRFYHLTNVPGAFNGDEASLGYNAYSILRTGHDEYGEKLPLVFKSFGDYKLPVFVYLLVPFIQIFDLTEFSVRLPSAIAGTLIILLTFLITIKLFKSKITALIAAFFVSISPWAIILSRGTWEATIGLLFICLGIYLFILGINRQKLLILSFLSLVLAFYSYNADRIVAPLMTGLLLWLFKKEINFSKAKLWLTISTLVIFSLPALLALTNFSGQSRAKDTLITDFIFSPSKDKYYGHINFLDRTSLSTTDIASKFFAYLSPANMFVYGDEVGRHGVEGFGVMYAIDFLFIVLAIYFLIKRGANKNLQFILCWIFIGLLPAMITKDFLHSIRSLAAMPAIYILSAWGVKEFLSSSRFNIKKTLFCLIISLLLILNFVMFLQSYFIFTPKARAGWWQYGSREIVQIANNYPDAQKVVVEGFGDFPSIYFNLHEFFLFYNKYDPNLYLKTGIMEDDMKRKAVIVKSFGKYEFRHIDWPEDSKQQNTLFIGPKSSLPNLSTNQYEFVKEILSPTGAIIFRVIKTN